MFGIDDAMITSAASSFLSSASKSAGGGIGSALSGAIGGLFGGDDGQHKAEEEAARVRDWQRMMSDSAYTRVVKDLKNAGLNPMLAYSQGGASTPGGVQAPTFNRTMNSAATAQAAASNVSAGAAATTAQASSEKMKAETDYVASQKQLAESQAALNVATLPKIAADVQASVSNANHLTEMVEALKRSYPLVGAQTKEVESRVPVNAATVGNLESQSHLARRHAGVSTAQEDLLTQEWGQKMEMNQLYQKLMNQQLALGGMAIPRASNESKAQGSWWMRNVSPYLPDVLKSASSALAASRFLPH